MAGYKGKNRLSVRAQRTKENLLAGMPLEPAMLKAGYSPGTARKQPHGTVGPIKRDLAAALERTGLTDDKFAERIVAGLKAKKDDAADWGARARAWDICVKVRGDAAPTNINHTGNVSLTVNDRREIQRSIWADLGGVE